MNPRPVSPRCRPRRCPRGCAPAGSSCRLQTRHGAGDRKSTRLNSSHVRISYAVFCLNKKKITAVAEGNESAADLRAITGLVYDLAQCFFFAQPMLFLYFVFLFNDTATTEIYTLSLHDALPISSWRRVATAGAAGARRRTPGRAARSPTPRWPLEARRPAVSSAGAPSPWPTPA